jgi:hypothetical protein
VYKVVSQRKKVQYIFATEQKTVNTFRRETFDDNLNMCVVFIKKTLIIWGDKT